jgi:predicted SAM-dependent methyltransferase
LSLYLRHCMGLKVTTFDFDESLKPDVVGDIRNLENYFRPNSFDVLCAFQVLEHLPFMHFYPSLVQMSRIAKTHVIISLPHWGYFFHVRLWVKRWQYVFGRKITRPFTWQFDGEHYWEIGTRDHPMEKIVKIISQVLDINDRYFCPDYPYHYFFECNVKET